MNQVVQQLRRMSLRIRRSRFGKRESWSSCASDETSAIGGTISSVEHVRTIKSSATAVAAQAQRHATAEQELEIRVHSIP